MDIIKDNTKICPKCGEKMIFDEGAVYTSIPPKYGYKCPKCGNYEYSTIAGLGLSNI